MSGDRPPDDQLLGLSGWLWLLSYKRLALRYDRTALTITALARPAVTLICARRLPAN